MSRRSATTGGDFSTGALAAGEPLSYESLRKVERGEMRIPRLTKLEGGFWARLSKHIAALRAAFAAEQDRDPTSRKTVLLADELRNTERLASSIWEIREKKIVQEALAGLRLRDRSRAEPPANMTTEEVELHRRLVEVLSEGRRRTVAGTGHAPAAPPASSGPAAVTPPAGAGGTPPTRTAPSAGTAATRPPPSGPEAAHAAASAPARPPSTATGPGGSPSAVPVPLVLVRALEDIPQFAGPDLATYALSKDEVGTIPEQAAKLLARRGKVTILPA